MLSAGKDVGMPHFKGHTELKSVLAAVSGFSGIISGFSEPAPF